MALQRGSSSTCGPDDAVDGRPDFISRIRIQDGFKSPCTAVRLFPKKHRAISTCQFNLVNKMNGKDSRESPKLMVNQGSMRESHMAKSIELHFTIHLPSTALSQITKAVSPFPMQPPKDPSLDFHTRDADKPAPSPGPEDPPEL